MRIRSVLPMFLVLAAGCSRAEPPPEAPPDHIAVDRFHVVKRVK